MNGWVRFGIVWVILMMMPSYGFIEKTIIAGVVYWILGALFPDQSNKSDDASAQVTSSSSISKPKSEQIIVNGKRMKVCPSCNAKVDEEANWCPQCGHQFKV